MYYTCLIGQNGLVFPRVFVFYPHVHNEVFVSCCRGFMKVIYFNNGIPHDHQWQADRFYIFLGDIAIKVWFKYSQMCRQLITDTKGPVQSNVVQYYVLSNAKMCIFLNSYLASLPVDGSGRCIHQFDRWKYGMPLWYGIVLLIQIGTS